MTVAAGSERGRLARVLLGPVGEPWWSRPALALILLLSLFLTTWALAINGDANTFYAAAALSDSESLKAFFFGALDAAGFITIDKPPLALWVDAASVRLFGLSSWSLLLPQAIEGVLTVLVVHRAVRPTFGAPAALLAALALALTPIAVAVDRGNNPDPLLVLLLALAAWGAVAAIRSGRWQPLAGAMVAVGLGFDAKMLQAELVVPAIVAAWLLGAKVPWRRSLAALGAALGVLVVVSLAWAVLVDAIPSQDRPYVGGSTDDSVLQLALGYNGLGRLFGQAEVVSPGLAGGAGSGGGGAGFGTGARPGRAIGAGGRPGGRPGFAGGPGGAGRRGRPGGGLGGGGGVLPAAGWTRLLGDDVGGQIAWLFPLAALGLVAAWVWRGPAPPPAPAGRSAPEAGRRGWRGALRTVLALRLSDRRAELVLWGGWLVTTVLVFSFAQGIWHPYYTIALAPELAATAGIGLVAMVGLTLRSRLWWWLLPVTVATTCAWSVVLLQRASGWQPWLTPVVVGAGAVALAGVVSAWLLAPLHTGGGRRGIQALLVAAAGLGVIAMLAGPAAYATTPLGTPISATFPSTGPATATFGAGGTSSSGTANRALDRYLVVHRDGATWLVAVVGSMVAAPIILDTGQPVMAMGGYNGNDPAPTAAELRAWVAQGELRYVLLQDRATGATAGPPGAIAWVREHCTKVPASASGAPGGETLYHCD